MTPVDAPDRGPAVPELLYLLSADPGERPTSPRRCATCRRTRQRG